MTNLHLIKPFSGSGFHIREDITWKLFRHCLCDRLRIAVLVQKIKLIFISFHSHKEWSDRAIVNLEFYGPDSQELVFFCFIS